MPNINLGRLEQIDLRNVWISEPADFTPWLAKEENLSLLADTLGLELELVEIEKGVGPFRADIVCKDTSNGSTVLIENQLERTDHSHMGQLLTYAAGLNASTVVWIAKGFTDEHRAALDWLNEHLGENANFFGLEIELWRIGDSAIAPKFNIVCSPNVWVKETSATSKDLTEVQRLQLEYWQAFVELVAERKSRVKHTDPFPQHWITIPIGRSGFHIAATVNTKETRIAVELYIGGPIAKKHFEQLLLQKDAIERDIGASLDWNRMPNKRACRILLCRPDSSITVREQWQQQLEWMLETIEQFDLAFRNRVQKLPSEYDQDEESEIADS